MAKFNVNRGGFVVDAPVSGTFTEGTALGLASNGVWTVVNSNHSLVRFVTAGYHSERDDVKMLGLARLVFGPMELTTDQFSGTLAVGNMVVANNGKLIQTTDPAEAIGYVVAVAGNIITVQTFK